MSNERIRPANPLVFFPGIDILFRTSHLALLAYQNLGVFFLIFLQNSSEKVRFSFILIDFVKILIEIVTSVSRFFLNFAGE